MKRANTYGETGGEAEGIPALDFESDPAERSALMRLFYRGWRPTRLGRWINQLQCWRSGLGLTPAYRVALEVTGRKSGRMRAKAVVIATLNGNQYLVSMLGPGSEWVKNVEAARGEVTIRHGRRRTVHLALVPTQQRAAVIREYVRVAQSGRRHFPLGPDAPLSRYESIADRYPVYRIDPAPVDQSLSQ
jgi:deazaflavin-dependent oxidoreductase (nitroreductase family)